jgi:hypothetical protein
MMPRKRVASELARSSRRGLPRGLDGFDRDVPIGFEIGLELGLCRGSYPKRRLSARRAIHLYAATFLMSAAAAASSPSASLITERRRTPTAAFASNMLPARRAASAMLLA